MPDDAIRTQLDHTIKLKDPIVNVDAIVKQLFAVTSNVRLVETYDPIPIDGDPSPAAWNMLARALRDMMRNDIQEARGQIKSLEQSLGGTVPAGSFDQVYQRFCARSDVDSTRQMTVEIGRFLMKHSMKGANNMIMSLSARATWLNSIVSSFVDQRNSENIEEGDIKEGSIKEQGIKGGSIEDGGVSGEGNLRDEVLGDRGLSGSIPGASSPWNHIPGSWLD